MSPMPERSGNPVHAVVFLYPLQGHIIPTYNLAKKIAANGVLVTLVCTEGCYARITKANGGRDPFADEATSLALPITTALVSDGLPADFDRSLHFEDFDYSLLNKMESHVEEFMRELQAKEPPISCIIADTFFVWAERIAKKFRVPYASFWTEPAMVFSIYYNWNLLIQNGHHPFRGNEADVINYIPGTRDLIITDLPSYLQEWDVSTLVHRVIYAAFQSVRGADWIISNTVHELEAQIVEEVEAQARIPYLSVGPLLPSHLVDGQGVGVKVGASMWAESDCRNWLDGKAKSMVIYVSFGSYAHVSKAQIIELAMGLLQSQRLFVWVLRPDIVASDEQDILPEGFLQKCKGQGMVVQWTSQLDMLSHPSVGGFLTHCGWNSVMESLWLGVPMLAFPLLTDQYTNCRLVVDEWQVAMRLGRTRRSLHNMRSDLVGREEIARTVEKFMDMDGEEGGKIRSNVHNVREVMKKAVLNGGSSPKNLGLFVEELKARGCSQVSEKSPQV
uniref:Glycosyltransferase n=1 Tax=Wollemia nobilis TaxID=56998 RepID=A0A0C9RK22_9CONI